MADHLAITVELPDGRYASHNAIGKDGFRGGRKSDIYKFVESATKEAAEAEIARTAHKPSYNQQLRSPAQQEKAYEQAQRQRWRALALVIKAKLEAVEAQITTFDDEFMAHIVLPSGDTVSAWLQPQIDEAYKTGKLPSSLLALPSPSSESAIDAEFR